MKKHLFAAVLLAVSSAALATGSNSYSSGLSGWKAEVAGSASSSSTGGSVSETSAQGNGFAANGTVNATGGEAKAWGSFNPQGVSVGTAQGSYSAGTSGSVKWGNATSQTAGGQGTDTNSYAGGSFKSGGFGGFGGFGH
jgi:hypothetical protein